MLAQSVQSFQTKLKRESYCRYASSMRKGAISTVSAFERDRMVGLREAGLSYRDITARTRHDATTVMRVWNPWREEGRTKRRAGTGPRNVTTARYDRHLVRMTVTDRTASSTVLSRRWSTATGLDLSASTVRRRLLRAGLVSRMPLRRLPLSRDHERLRLQWARERRHWRAEWRNVVFSGECRFNKSYNDGRIRVRRYAGERNLRARSCLLRIEGNKNSNRYIREILQAEVLPSFRQLHMPYFNRTMPGHTWKGLCNLLPKTTGMTASLACTFVRHVAHGTCQGYGWSATYSSESSSTYP